VTALCERRIIRAAVMDRCYNIGSWTFHVRSSMFSWPLKIDILTLFPEICRAPLSESIMKRAQENKIVDLRIHNLRDWTKDKHRIVDDAPFGGGQGMVMKPEPIFAAVEELRAQVDEKSKIILMSPAGRRFDQPMAERFSRERHLIVICGHYEGVDHRVIEHLVDLEISIGDYVLTNGAIAAVVLVDAIVRLLPGALGHEQSAADDSFSGGLLEAPQYTRPAEFRDWKVPAVLVSGNHAEIAAWRKKEALRRTRENRPDLLGRIGNW
jgi:tRNA (guanine37-N1)-methyltransferase